MWPVKKKGMCDMKTQNNLISIIVPCYNSEMFLKETLDCLRKQTYTNWECIIVNDGSTDSTQDIATLYVESDNRYILVNKENGGLADARNAGIKASHGEYILPLDSDDLIASSYIEKAVGYLSNHPEITLVYCRAKFFGDRNEEWLLPDYNYETLLYRNLIFCSCIYRRSDYDKTEGYNTNMSRGLEDWDFLLSLLTKESSVYKIPEVLFFYRKHGNSMLDDTLKHRNEMEDQIVTNHLELYRSHFHNIMDYRRAQRELNILSNSFQFKLGGYILTPFRIIRSLITSINKKGIMPSDQYEY